MTTWITPETIVQLVLVRILANVGADKLTAYARIGNAGEAPHDILVEVVQVGLTTREKIGSWFAKEVLHAVGDEPCSDDRERQAQPASM